MNEGKTRTIVYKFTQLLTLDKQLMLIKKLNLEFKKLNVFKTLLAIILEKKKKLHWKKKGETEPSTESHAGFEFEKNYKYEQDDETKTETKTTTSNTEIINGEEENEQWIEKNVDNYKLVKEVNKLVTKKLDQKFEWKLRQQALKLLCRQPNQTKQYCSSSSPVSLFTI